MDQQGRSARARREAREACVSTGPFDARILPPAPRRLGRSPATCGQRWPAYRSQRDCGRAVLSGVAQDAGQDIDGCREAVALISGGLRRCPERQQESTKASLWVGGWLASLIESSSQRDTPSFPSRDLESAARDDRCRHIQQERSSPDPRTPIAIEFVPRPARSAPIGRTCGSAFVRARPIMCSSMARGTWAPAIPKCDECRTTTMPIPVEPAMAIARSITRIATG